MEMGEKQVWHDKNGTILTHGMIVVHDRGDVEKILVRLDGDFYIDGEKCIFPLMEFPYRHEGRNYYLTEFMVQL